MTNETPPASHEPQAAADDESHRGEIFDGLTPLQVKAILALLNEPTIVRAASTVGVDERSIRRWLEDPTFKRAYHAARREAFDHAIGLTQRYAPLAVNTLAKTMNDPDTPARTKSFGGDGAAAVRARWH